MAIGVGAAISLMGITKTTHPPAGADPLVVIMAGADGHSCLPLCLPGPS